MKKYQIILVICLSTFLSWGPQGWAQEQTVTLAQTIKTAFKNNPSIESSRHEVAVLEAMVDQATATYFPQVSNTTNYFRVGGDLPDMIGGLTQNLSNQTGNTGVPVLDSPLNVYTTGFTVSQYLYDFGKTSGTIENRQQYLAAGRKDLEKSIADVIRRVKVAYFQMLKNIRLADVARQSLATCEKHLEQARALFEEGLRPKIDVSRSQVDRAKSKLALLKAEFAIRTARVDLENVIGGPPVEGPYIPADVTALPSRPLEVDPLLAKALENRPEIEALKNRIKAAEAQLKIADSEYWPTVSANGGYGWASTEFPLKDYWMAGVTLKWEIFSGFRTKGQEKESQAAVAGLKADLRKMELDVNQEVLNAFIHACESFESITVAETALKEAEENMALAQGRYRTGLGNAIEFSDAEMLLTAAGNDLTNATYDYLQNLAQLEYAVGGWRESASLTGYGHKPGQNQ